MHIRAVAPTDIDAIYSIALRTGASGQDATHQYSDGKLVGHIWAAPYVLLQGKGVGATLITRWLDHMRSLGSRGAHFAVSPANTRALAFYRAHGFVELPRANVRPQEPIWFAMRLA